ncbi:uncharacterized protein LOC143046627 [Mytilus galloprovincialis]|uniref:uncharacterized protein LOC143046627 n=1 Tax=Mytilus galloprovincialis TaxID=29158 RepID=UPI003F7B8E31
MCTKCRDRIHPKFRNAKDHTIVDIKEVGFSTSKTNPDFTAAKCKVHSIQSCCLFCSTCDVLVCPVCIAKPHAGHLFVEIKEAYDLKVEKLKTRKMKLQNKEKGLNSDERKLDVLKRTEISKGMKVLQDIQSQKEAYNKYTDKLSERVQEKIKVSKDFISKQQKKAKKSKTKVQKESNKVQDLLNSIDIIQVVEHIESAEKSLETLKQPISLSCTFIPRFIPRIISESVVGSLVEETRIDEVEMKVNKQFITKLEHCHFLSCCSDGSLWLGDSNTDIFQKIKPDGENLTTIFTTKTIIRGIGMTLDGNILLADSTSTLKLINGTTGRIHDSRYSVDPLLIMSLHVTKDHKVIVGAMSPGEVIPVKGRRVVIVIDQDGKHRTVHEYEKNKQRLLTYPQSVTSTNNGIIFVADYAVGDKINSRILAIDEEESVIGTYNGLPDINTVKDPFQPICLTRSPSDKVIISDFNLGIIHILDNLCNLLSYFKTTEIGIDYPHSTTFKNTKIFYIGCGRCTSTTTNAKIYEIEYSGL